MPAPGLIRLTSLAPVLLAVAAPAAAQESAPTMTAELLATMDRLGDISISPDGRWMAYVVRTTSADRATSATHILIADQDRPDAPHQRLAGGPARQDMPSWSADGSSLYFRGPDAKGVAQIWRAAIGGAAPVQLTRGPLDVGSFRTAPDGSFAVAAYRVYPDCPTLECSVTRAAKPSAGTLYTGLNVRFYDSFFDGRYNHLFKLSLRGAHDPVPLMSGMESDAPSRPSGSARAFTLSPDGRTLVFTARRSGVYPSVSTTHRLFQVSLAAPEAPKEVGGDANSSQLNPTFSPDGKLLAYTAAEIPGSDGELKRVQVRDLATGTIRQLGAAVDRWPNAIAWAADGKSILAINDDDGRERLYAYRLTGAAERLPVDGVSQIDVSRRGLALSLSGFAAPPQLFASGPKGQALRQVTRVAEAQLEGVALAPTHSFTFKGWNDEPVQAFVTEPLNREPGRRYPVLFLIHGGPHGVYQDEWLYGRNPQVWAAKGYATVMVNFHGSTGFGQSFAHAVIGRRGDSVLEDLKRGWAAALDNYPYLDGKRSCAMGSSFGGYMIFWIAGVWSEPWRCLISHAGTLDARAYTSDLLWHGDRQFGSTYWDDPESVERFNAIRHVGKWEKPLLVTHGLRDYRVPFDQGLAAFTIAQKRGIPSELFYMPNEGHSVTGTAASIQWYDVVQNWLDRWTAP